MGRQQVYGKRSQTLFDPRAAVAFSSPEHPPQKPTKPDVVEPAAVKKIVLSGSKRVTRGTDTEKGDNKTRRVLGEKSSNAAVRPVEVVAACTLSEITATPKKSRKPAERREANKSGTLTSATFEDHVVAPEANVKSEAVVKKKSKSRHRHREGEGQTEKSDMDAEAIKQTKLKRKAAKAVRKEELRLAELAHQQESTLPTRYDPSDAPDAKTPPAPFLSTSEPYESYCSSLLLLSSHPLTPFSSWSSEISEHFSVTKIAEASFGEVYRLSLRVSLPEFSKSEESVFKIIALRPPESTFPQGKKRNAALKKAEMMSVPLDVANEVKLLQRMSSTPGFTNFRDLRILQGRPPKAFIKAFHKFNAAQGAKGKDLSHFPDPSRKANYAADQLWAIIEMQDAGTDLEQLVEGGECAAVWDVWDVFWQVVLSLAKGEEGAEFEHRDLHLGNICVNRRHTSENAEIDIKKKLGFTGIETTIIDYTISRCRMQDDSIAHLDLDRDSTLFEGDSTEEYQYDIYRYMRGMLYLDSAYSFPTEEEVHQSGRNWEQFHPQTNLVWLHLVLYKLLEQMQWPSSKRAPTKKMQAQRKLWKRACDLEYILSKVQELLDPGAICENGIRSARDLVLLAIEEQWLDCIDVVGQGVEDDDDLASQMDALEV